MKYETRNDAWTRLLHSLYEAMDAADNIPPSYGGFEERDEMHKVCEHFVRSAVWHKKQYE